MNCTKCHHICIKNGFQSNGKQRYYCKSCNYHQQKVYRYNAYKQNTNASIYKLLINSCGINDIARVLSISKNTVSSRILKMAHLIKTPVFNEHFQSYEMDELYTKIHKKQCWIIYAINRKTKKVINYAVGSKTNQNLSKVVNTLLLLNPKKIYTDKLKSYNTLIPKKTHNNSRYQTNRIERFNLNLRTHLKRLHRRTICYSKSIRMLESIIKIYFWGYQLGFK